MDERNGQVAVEKVPKIAIDGLFPHPVRSISSSDFLSLSSLFKFKGDMGIQVRIKVAIAAVFASFASFFAAGLFAWGGLPASAKALFFASLAALFGAAAYAAALITGGLLNPLKRISSDAGSSMTGGPPPSFCVKEGDALGPVKDAFNKMLSALKEEKKEMKDILDSMPAAALQVDRKANIVSMNAEAGRLFGYEGLKGTPFTALLQRDSRPVMLEAIEEAFKGYVSKKTEVQIITPEGRPSLFELTALPALISGEAAGARLLMKNLDEVKGLREELAKTKTHAEETERRLKETINDLEEFALLAVRRELKMKEIRERFKELSEGKEGEKEARR